MSRLNSFASGIKVLDLSQYIPGPLTSLILADMGADVVKIEPPHGDEMRNLGPRGPDGAPVFYETLNAGKRVFRMNLKDPATRAEFLELVKDADVLIEGFRPGVMARLGLDFATLTAVNPRLIFCAMSGYGPDGTMARTAGHDGNYLALSGILDRNGGERPVIYDPPVADMSGALFAAIAILGALLGRGATGKGCAIDLALADVAMPLQLLQIADFGANGTVPKPASTYLNGGAAYYQVYRTLDDRAVMLGCVEPKFWRVFCAAADRPDWLPRQAEAMPQTRLIADLDAFFATLTQAECVGRFTASDCCLTPVLDIGEALTSERIAERRLVRPGPGGALQALFPAFCDGAPPASRAPLDTAPDPAAGKPLWRDQQAASIPHLTRQSLAR